MKDYELGRMLGRGGMGEVYIARDPDGRFVALKKVRKTLSLDPVLCERLTVEAQILRRIEHPNVVRVLGGGMSTSGQPYMVMSRAFGRTLDTLLTEGRTIARERMAPIASQFLDGMTAIHAAGVVHADIKSSNVLIDELDRVTIIDFGLSRLSDAEPSPDEIFGGTPAYMAPEVLAGSAPTIASDIYAAGVVIYEMLTGTTPLPRNLSAVVVMSLRMAEPTEAPSRRTPERGISRALDAVIARALAMAPTARYASAQEFGDALALAFASWQSVADDKKTAFWQRTPTPANIAPTERRAATKADVERIIQQGLGLALSRVDVRQTEDAIAAIEDALVSLSPSDPNQSTSPDAWRLESVLAALYQSTGRSDRAGRLARRAHSHAHQTGDREAISRTTALVSKLAVASKRIARGSQPPTRAKKRTSMG